MGRPATYTAADVDAIVARLATGEPLAQICRDEGMPYPSTVRDWMAADPEVARRIAQAREDGFDAIALEALAISDDGKRDYVFEEGSFGVNTDHIQRSKLRVDTRLKLLAKWDPKRYGERVAHELSGPGGGAVQLVAGTMTPEQAAEAYAATIRGNG